MGIEYIEEIKICTRCGERKPLIDFRKDASRPGGFHSWCKICNSQTNTNGERNNRFKFKYPAPDKCVYAFLEEKEIVYVGESAVTSRRIAMHYGDSQSCFCPEINKLERKKRFKYVILWHGDDDSMRKQQEKELIKLHQPEYNTTHR